MVLWVRIFGLVVMIFSRCELSVAVIWWNIGYVVGVFVSLISRIGFDGGWLVGCCLFPKLIEINKLKLH